MSAEPGHEYPWTNTSVDLWVESASMNADGITARLGVAPTRTWVETSPGGGMLHMWRYQVPGFGAGDAVGELLQLVSVFEPVIPALAGLSAQGARLSVTVRGYVATGSVLRLAPELVHRVAALGVPVTFSTMTGDR